MSLDGNSTLTVSNNLFQNNYVAVNDTYGYQPMNFQHNTFANNYSAFAGIRTVGGSYFNFNNFQDNTNVFEYGYYFDNVDVSSNNFDGSDLVIRAPEVGYGYGTVSMLNNWWGTTNVNAIEGMIYDRNDLGTLQGINYSISSQPFSTAGIQFSSIAPVPLPESYLMMLVGICMMGFIVRRHHNNQA